MKCQILFSWKKIRKVEDILKYFFLFFQVKQVLTFQANCLHGKISRIHFVKVFIIFQETGFTFHANCLQIMHEISNLFYLGKI